LPIARLFLDLTGVLNVFFGLVYLVAPALLTEPSGLSAVSPTGLTDIRAIYGGLQIGWGAFEIWTARDASRYEAGLVCTLLMCLGLAGCRWIGIGLVGELSSTDRSAIRIESIWALSSAFVWWRYRRKVALDA
jgi:hypothetical protein